MIVPELTPPAVALQPKRAKAANNIFWLIAERAVKAGGGLVMGVLIARHLGPDHYGCYGAAIGIATLAKEAVMLGFDRMIRRDLAARPSDAGKIIGTSIAFSVLLGFAAATGFSALAHRFVQDAETHRLTLIVVWMAIPQAFYSCEVWFESAGQARALVRTRNAVWSVAKVVSLILVLTGAPVVAFAIVALTEWAATYAAVCVLLRRTHPEKFNFSFDANQLKSWFKEGWPMVVMIAFGSTADRSMVLFVHNIAGSEAQAGYLNAALRITEVWWSVSTIVAAVLLPRIVALRITDPERCAKAMQLYANASLLVATAAAIVVTFTAPFVIPRVFGQSFAPTVYVLVITFWAGPAIFPAAARAQFWVSRGRLILDLPTVIGTAIIQMALAIFLVPRWGAIGSAAAMVGAQWLGVYLITALVPPMKRESELMFGAFKSLLDPIATLQQVWLFFGGMVRKA